MDYQILKVEHILVVGWIEHTILDTNKASGL